MSEFKVSKRAIQEVDTTSQATSEYVEPYENFEVPNQVMSELGKLAGDASDAHELLESESTPSAKKLILDPEAVEHERVSRNFSFTNGETQHVYDQLSARNKLLARRLRGKLLAHFNSIDKEGGRKAYEGIFSENSIGLLRVATFSGPPNGLYLAHLGKPIQDAPVLSEFIRAGRKQYSDKRMSKSIRLRYLADSFEVIDLAKTPAYNSQVLSRSMGGSREDWEKTLPTLGKKIHLKENEHSWDLWAPAIEL